MNGSLHRAELVPSRASQETLYAARSGDCRKRYAITDGIPVMLVEESVTLEPPDWDEAMKKRAG